MDRLKKSCGKPFFAGSYLLLKNKRRSFVSERHSLQIWTHVNPFFEQRHPCRLVILGIFFSFPSWGSTRTWRSSLCHYHQSPCIGILLFYATSVSPKTGSVTYQFSSKTCLPYSCNPRLLHLHLVRLQNLPH